MCPYVFIEWTQLGVEWQKTGRATSCSKTAQILSTDVIQLNFLFLKMGKCLNYVLKSLKTCHSTYFERNLKFPVDGRNPAEFLYFSFVLYHLIPES